SIVATLYPVTGGLVGPDCAGLSEWGWKALGLAEGDEVRIGHAPPLESLGPIRGKVHGNRLDASAPRDLDHDEIRDLTAAMVGAGERIDWGGRTIVDKHSVGGLPGNRTTPIVVAIAAASGLVIPKTSSRAITSPAGTADTMETLAPVELDLATMR